jgi:trimeric autotransporter adhesin
MKNIFAMAASILALSLATPAMAQSSLSTVDQIGIGNGVTVEQLGAAAINDSKIKQGLNPVDVPSELNTARVIQDGFNVLKNISTIDQDGFDNDASTTQGGNGTVGDINQSKIDQAGDNNTAWVVQGNAQLDNDSTVIQSGVGNLATADQGGTAEGNSNHNDSGITQLGDDNDARVHQGGSSLADNLSTVTQTDSFGLGGGNTALVNQHGSSDNDSIILQDGGLNGATISQSTAVEISNISILTQLGLGNLATVNQR